MLPRDQSNGAFDLSYVLLGVVLDQVLDHSGLSNARWSVHQDDEGRRHIVLSFHNRNCIDTSARIGGSL